MVARGDLPPLPELRCQLEGFVEAGVADQQASHLHEGTHRIDGEGASKAITVAVEGQHGGAIGRIVDEYRFVFRCPAHQLQAVPVLVGPEVGDPVE